MDSSRIEYWLALKLVPRLAIHKKIALINQYGLSVLFSSSTHTAAILTKAKLTEKQRTAFINPDWHKIHTIIRLSEQCQSQIIPFDHPYYPAQLKQLYDPPLVLFTKGNAAILNDKQLAIVGSRYASVNGRDAAFDFAKDLVSNHVVITSGLALGIDAAAHRGALAGHGKTIAVVATGLDIVYPLRHTTLAQQILENNGVIISEFLPTTSPKPGHFPKRNRLISGLSEGVLVVEAAIKSGSLITARCAIEQNKDVFAVPGALNNPLTKGCHYLIKQGAKLVEDCADIIIELDFPDKSGLSLKSEESESIAKQSLVEKSHIKDLCNNEMLASVGYDVTPIDKIVAQGNVAIDVVLTQLTMLELKGLVSAVPGGYIRL